MPDATRFVRRPPEVAAAETYFPERVWGADYWATVVLADFVSYMPAPGGVPVAWNAVLNDPADSFLTVPGINFPNPPFANATAMLDAELAELAALIPYRPSVQAEILSQKDAILPYFRGILSYDLRTHPATVFLCTAALCIGGFQALYYKNIFNRARPSRFSPDLMPLLDPPGHASYPSGHATQSRLIALCLEQVMPSAIVPVAAPPPPPPPLLDPVAELSPLRMMASRIARNREVAGVHYPSDSLIGKKLANGSFGIMMQLAKVTDLITAARLEWAPRA
jgi:membrane-associated phospholipid phosphatase